MALSLVLSGEQAETAIDLEDSRSVRIGRSPTCDVVLSDRSVSRVHAEIRMESENLVLRDLDSRNGTFVNDVRILSKVLSAGDRIRLGSADVVLALRGPVLTADSRSSVCPGEQGVVSGVVESISVVDLVQVLAASGKTGTLMLFGDRFGRIDFLEGNVCFAEVDGVGGAKAFHRLLGWGEAEFRFSSGRPSRENVRLATDCLLVEAVRQQEEMEELRRRLPDADAELSLNFSANPPPLSLLEADVLERALKLKTLTRVMNGCPHSDVEVARALHRLIEAQVLVSAHAVAGTK